MFSYKNPKQIRLVEENIFSALENFEGANYDKMAQTYERMVESKIYNKIVWGTTPDDYKKFAKSVISKSNENLLDIGCGGLVQTADIYSNTKRQVMLLDNSIEMLKIGKKRIVNLCGAAPENITFIQGDAFNLPFKDSSVDNICSFGILHLFDNKQELINEFLRVLKPNKQFYITSLTNNRLASKFYMGMLRKGGEFGEPMSPDQTLSLFDNQKVIIDSYTKGAMIFISGTKL